MYTVFHYLVFSEVKTIATIADSTGVMFEHDSGPVSNVIEIAPSLLYLLLFGLAVIRYLQNLWKELLGYLRPVRECQTRVRH